MATLVERTAIQVRYRRKRRIAILLMVSSLQLAAKEAKIKAAQEAKKKVRFAVWVDEVAFFLFTTTPPPQEEDEMIARMGKPKTNGAAKTPIKAPTTTTAFSKGSADEQAAEEAARATTRRDELKAKTAEALARKKERMDLIQKLNVDNAMLNATAATLYGTDAADDEEEPEEEEEAAAAEEEVAEEEATD